MTASPERTQMSWSPRDSTVGAPGPFAPTRKLIKFLIMFDNSNLLFFPGQFLSGRVIVEVEEDMAVLGKPRPDILLVRKSYTCNGFVRDYSKTVIMEYRRRFEWLERNGFVANYVINIRFGCEAWVGTRGRGWIRLLRATQQVGSSLQAGRDTGWPHGIQHRKWEETSRLCLAVA